MKNIERKEKLLVTSNFSFSLNVFHLTVSTSPQHFSTGRLVKWCFTPLSTVYQSYHGDSSHYSCLSWVLPVLGWDSEVSGPRTLPQKKPQKIQCGSTLGPLDYESNTSPLSYVGPHISTESKTVGRRFIDIETVQNLFPDNG